MTVIPHFVCILFSLSALEPRTVTRWDIHKFARKAYDLGVRFIGGCCGFEAYHIRAIAEEVNRFSVSVYSKYLQVLKKKNRRKHFCAIFLFGNITYLLQVSSSVRRV